MLPYAAFLTGASLAMPDRFLAPEPLAAFIAAARPNKAADVPTVWQSPLAGAQPWLNPDEWSGGTRLPGTSLPE